MDNNVTIVIPGHNRPERLRRLLNYLLDRNCTVVVVDSSDVEFKYLCEFAPRITYRFEPKVPLAEKLVSVKGLVNTPYVVMCADDDFVIPGTIRQITDFLDVHNDYSTGQGLYFQCRVSHDGNKTVKNMYPWLIKNSLTEESPGARVKHLENNYYQFYYAVYRTDVFFDTFANVIDNYGVASIKNLCILETYMAMYGACRGKHIVLPELFNVREYIEGSAASYVPNLFYLRDHNLSESEFRCWKELILPFFADKKDPSKYYDSVLNNYYTSERGLLQKVIHKLKPYVSKVIEVSNRKQDILFQCADRNKAERELKAILDYYDRYADVIKSE